MYFYLLVMFGGGGFFYMVCIRFIIVNDGYQFYQVKDGQEILYMDLVRVCFNSVLYKYKFEGGGGGVLIYDIWFCIIMLKLLELIFLWNININVFFI